eukprot:TRINITY_DN53512_c0_g1_i1.p2 TRINITY_DN53512_c0_g1~~TRINITY_DN53512_c0_g1_i1.p2  ORF type:complete len:105 (-),score=32.37 TRINITY_DN53512_c0_g1_i1:1-315(-)
MSSSLNKSDPHPKKQSRANRMRAECAAWGASAGKEEDDDDEQALQFEEELAMAAADRSVLRDWRVADLDVEAELDRELASELDPTLTNRSTMDAASACDSDQEY